MGVGSAFDRWTNEGRESNASFAQEPVGKRARLKLERCLFHSKMKQRTRAMA